MWVSWGGRVPAGTMWIDWGPLGDMKTRRHQLMGGGGYEGDVRLERKVNERERWVWM